MTNSIFREDALLSQQKGLFGSALNVKLPSFKWFFVGVTLLCAILFFFLFRFTISKSVEVFGHIVLKDGLIDVQPQRIGVVTSKHISEGQRVEMGDLLFVLSNEVTTFDKSKNNKKINKTDTILNSKNLLNEKLLFGKIDLEKYKNNQLSHLDLVRQSISTELSQLEKELGLQEKKVEEAELLYIRFTQMLELGVATSLLVAQKKDFLLSQQLNFEQLKQKKTKLLRELAINSNEKTNLLEKIEHEEFAIERQLQELNQSSTITQADETYGIVAPVSGVIATVNANIGQQFKDQTMATIIPNNSELICELYVPSSTIANVKNGDEWKVKVDAYPYLKHGYLIGVVKEINQSNIKLPDSLANINALKVPGGDIFYRVRLSFKKNPNSSIDVFSKKHIFIGMKISSKIVQNRQSIIEWILEPLEQNNNEL